MGLTTEQIDGYHRAGFLECGLLFAPDEVTMMTAELPCVLAEESPRRILERSGAVRSIFSSHLSNDLFRCVSSLDRIVEPARQLLGSDVYIHQFKINAKLGLDGEMWDWHQDFLFWHKEDGMPSPRVLTAAIFLDDVNDFNGPLLLIPGSHTKSVDLQAQPTKPGETTWSSTLTADLKYKVDKKLLAPLQQKHGIHAAKGEAGSVLFFHGDAFHASAPNLSAWDRFVVFITFNSVENTLLQVSNPRPDYIASRDYTPVRSLPDTALRQMHSFPHLMD